jgi:hypothetical protein
MTSGRPRLMDLLCSIKLQVMETMPAYVYLVFIATVIIAAALLYSAAHYARPVIVTTGLWLALQAAVSLAGFYTVTNVLPPRFPLLILPPLILLVTIGFTKWGRRFADSMDPATLTLLHIIRIPVEVTLYWLCLHKAVPDLITFQGTNFDVLSGLTAPLVYYFGYVRKVLGRKTLIAWNVACLLLLGNVVITAILSTPLQFQQFAFSQPNIAMFYCPFTWLPCFLVPLVLFAHVVCLRGLLKGWQTSQAVAY